MVPQTNLIRHARLLAVITLLTAGLPEKGKLRSDDVTLPSLRTVEATTQPVDPMASITMVPRDRSGKKSAGEKAAESAVGGLIGSVPGGAGSGPKHADRPGTRRGPTRKQDYAAV